jgi:O-antigen ligase
MRRHASSIIVAGYLLLCILLGGSAQGLWSKLLLQLLGVALIAWSAVAAEPASEESDNPVIVYLLLGAAGLIVLQLIPLPASLWTKLPGREGLGAGLELVGERGAAMPLSQTPDWSVFALFAVIPGLAMFIAAKMLRPSAPWLAFAIIAGMTCSIALGALQVAGGTEKESWAYLYPVTNSGAVGVFANRNHMGTLLLVSIPFATALLVSARTSRGGSAQGRWAIGIAALILAVVGIILNGSLAAISLALPVLVASASQVPAALRWRSIALPLAAVALVGGVTLLATSPIATVVADPKSDSSISSRHEIWSNTVDAIRDSFPAGAGLGSFEHVYRQYEDPADATGVYVNHAHNDYLELVLELGAAGLLLIVLFLGWWAVTSVRVWTTPLSTPFGRAATIASATILAHSAVDYPLRTAAIAAIFGIAIALMAQRLGVAEPESAGTRGAARHLRIG